MSRGVLPALLTTVAACLVGFTPMLAASGDGCHPSASGSTATSAAGAFMVTGTNGGGACHSSSTSSGGGPHLQITQPACELGSNVICQQTVRCEGGGKMWETVWVYPDGHTRPGPETCVGGDAAPPAPAQVTSAKVLTAFRSVPLPTPTLGMSPPDGITLVNLPTIFFTRAEPFWRDLKLLGRRVHLEIAPVSYAWSVGPGAEFTTDWAGAPYQDGVTPQEDPDAYVTWTYPHAAASQAATVRVTWGATWTLDGKPMGRVPGTVDMTSPAAQVTVREARGVLTGAAER
jgi:hypothetical protein